MEKGKRINKRYEVVYKVADGGMGELYYVRDMKLNGMPRALKMLQPIHDRKGEQPLLEQEAYLLTRLRHRCLPNIFDFYASDEEGGRSFLVMEWIEGVHLGQWLKEERSQVTLPYLYYAASEVLAALCYLHAQQPAIIHRDLKPANIMLARDGSVKLIDFGISKQLGRADRADGDTLPFGTRGYAAPEQLLGKHTDERSDIYSFGAVLLAMLGIDPTSLLGSGTEHRELRHKLASIPKGLRQLIIDCVQEQPQHRPQRASVLLNRLHRLAAENGWTSGKIETMQQGTVHSALPQSFRQGRKIAVLGAHDGAGATLLSLALAYCCEISDISLTYIEHRSSGAELYYSFQQMHDEYPDYRVHHDVSAYEGDQVVEWFQSNSINYAVANPLIGKQAADRMSLTYGLCSLQVLQRDVVVDYSSHWQVEHIEGMLQHADWIIIVNSPWLVRSQQHMYKLQQLLKQAAEKSMPVIWISNRDQQFRQRSKWLELNAGLTHLKIPELSTQKVLDSLWDNASMPPHSSIVKELAKYLMPLIKKVIHLQ